MPAAPAIIGAVGAIGGGLMSSRGASAAADAQTQASQQANQAQIYMFNQAMNSSRPQIEAGNVARNQLMEMLGLEAQNSQRSANYSGGSGMISPQNFQGTGYLPSTREPMPDTFLNPGGLWDALTGSSAENRTRALIHGPLASIAPDPFLDGLYPEERRLAPLDFSMGAGGNGYQGLRDAGQGTSSNWGGNNSRGAGYRVGDNQRLVDGPTADGTSSAANQNGNSGLDAYLNSIGYQFERDQGLESVNRSAAARGGALSGRALMESQQYGQGLASQRAGDYMNRLASLAGAGQTATSGVNTLGYNTGQGIANNLNNAGNARASGYINQANAYGNMFNNLGQMGAYYFGNNGGGS